MLGIAARAGFGDRASLGQIALVGDAGDAHGPGNRECKERGQGGQYDRSLPFEEASEQLPQSIVVRADEPARGEASELLRHFASGRVPFSLAPSHRLLRDRDQVARRLGAERQERGGRFDANARENFFIRVLRVRGPAADEVIHHRAKRVDVRAPVDAFPLRLLGGHVGRSSDDDARRRHVRGRLLVLVRSWHRFVLIDVFCEAPVDDDRLAEGTDKDVGRFQIAMQDADAVRVGHRLGHVHENWKEGETVLQIRRLHERSRECVTLDELQRVECLAIGPSSRVVQGHDVRVGELRGDADLAPEASGRGGSVAPELLQRHETIEPDVARAQNAADSAPRDLFPDLVALR